MNKLSLMSAAALMAMSFSIPLSSNADAAPRSGNAAAAVVGHGGGGGGGGGGGSAFRGGGGGGKVYSGGGNRRGYGGGGYRGPRSGDAAAAVVGHPRTGRDHGRHGGQKYRRYGGYYSVPLYDYSDYSYGSNCSWLWRRWQATGNPKWRARYYDCID